MRHLEIQKNLNSLSTKYYNVLLGRMYFTGDDDFQNMAIYIWTYNRLEI